MMNQQTLRKAEGNDRWPRTCQEIVIIDHLHVSLTKENASYLVQNVLVNYDHQGMGVSGVVNMISPCFVYFCHSVALELKCSSIKCIWS